MNEVLTELYSEKQPCHQINTSTSLKVRPVFMFKLLLLLSLLLLLLLLLLLFALTLLLTVEMTLADRLKVIMRKLMNPKAEKLWHFVSRPVDDEEDPTINGLFKWNKRKKWLIQISIVDSVTEKSKSWKIMTFCFATDRQWGRRHDKWILQI